MSNSTIVGKAPSISIDEVYHEITQWRANKVKHNQPNIPDELWRKILTLVAQFDISTVKALLGVSSDQIKHKQTLLNSPEKPVLEEIIAPPTVPAAPAKAERPSKFYQPAALPSKQTFVVELHHDSGKLMKIHSTTDTLRELVCAFYGEDEPCCN